MRGDFLHGDLYELRGFEVTESHADKMQRWCGLVELERPLPLFGASMPVRLVAQRVDVNAPRGGLSRNALPPRVAVGVRDGDLEAVGRKPPGVVEVFIAIAATIPRALDHHFA